MKDILNTLLGRRESDQQVERAELDHRIRVATAALLLEIANADRNFTEREQQVIVDVLKDRFSITQEEVEAILKESSRELQKRHDLYAFSNLINKNFDRQEKQEIIEMVWRVIYADRHLSGYEDHLVHKFSRILLLDHYQLIEAKMKVKKELENQ